MFHQLSFSACIDYTALRRCVRLCVCVRLCMCVLLCVCVYLDEVEHSHWLQRVVVVLHQRVLGDPGPGHDVVQDALQHALTGQPVDAAVHHSPGPADVAHLPGAKHT